MPRHYYLFLLAAACMLFAQQPTPEQIREAKKQVNADPQAARQQIQSNPQLLDKLTPDQRAQVMNYIDSVERSKSGAAPRDSALRKTRIADTSDTARDTTGRTMADSLGMLPQPDSLAQTPEPEEPESTMVFGRHLFKQKFLAPIHAETPDDYIIAPGDEILLRFWGRYNQERKYLIGQDGYVFIEPLNRQAYLIGMTYGSLKAMVQRVSAGSPGVEGDVRVVSAHPIYVHIAGSALNPGTVSAPAFYSFWQFLLLSKGPDQTGSVRDIRVSRKGKVLATIDLYEFLRSGKKPVITLQSDDLIFFGPAQAIVRIDSLAKKPGLYELKDNETLGSLLEIAGGLRSGPIAPSVQIHRIADPAEKLSTGIPYKVFDIDMTSESWKKTVLKDGDIVTCKTMAQQTANDVYLMGTGIAVPGRYSITQTSQTLADLLKEAGGLAAGANRQAELLRRNDDKTRFSIPIDLFNTQALAATRLMPHDSIVTFNDSQFVEITLVESRGFVRKQIMERYSDSLTLADVLLRSEGIRDGGMPYVYVKRTDDFNNISYHRFDVSDQAAAARVPIDKRDEVLAFSYDEFNKKLPVTVLAYGKEPLLLQYSPDLTFDVVLHEIGGLSFLIDSSRIEVCIPDFGDEMAYGRVETYALNEQTSDKKGIIKQGSILFIRRDEKKNYGYFITLGGEVMRPGRYPLLRRDSKLSEVFSLAGGLTERANKWGICIMREGRKDTIPVEVRDKRDLLFVNDWILNPNDRIMIARNDYSIEVRGAVFNPRTVAYTPGYSCMDYVRKAAGGLLDSANGDRTYVQYANGITKKAKNGIFSMSPKIHPGCRIVVPFKPPRPPKQPGEGFDYTKFVSATSASMVTLLSILVIANQLK